MLRAVGVAALSLLFWLPGLRADAADDHVACVQGQLAALGFDPGPMDGLSGPRTRAALRAYLEGVTSAEDRAVFDRLPDFVERSAVGWCREIGMRAPEAAALMPSRTPPQVFVGADVHPELEAHVRVAFQEAEDFLQRRYGVQVASQVRIILATNVEDWHDLVGKAGTMRLQSWGEIRARGKRDCETEFGLGASASRDGLSFCGKVLALKEPALAELYRLVLSVTMTHEMVHNAQREFTFDKVARWVTNPDAVRPRMGPAWMVEGSAQVIEQAFMKDRYGRGQPTLDGMQALAAASELDLRQIRLAREVRVAEAYDVSAFGVALLIDRFGEETLFRYWREVGETDNWFTAFRNVYGMSVEEFETLYPMLRDDQTARAEFIEDRDVNGDRALAHRPLTEAELMGGQPGR
ncbi:peptidoglycan-binding domain-containing protein [Antarctobacter jejuensis]|uniref:peptidoglycan-binding domain-containing protein n=1 Tax=Antarctobacter jejuensis TaxID=1439938 RepID=UPI003FD05766